MSVKPTMILCGLVLLGTSTVLGSPDEPRIADRLDREFDSSALPLVKKYCLECHSADEQEGEVDLERFTRFDQVRNAPRIWQKVGEVLDKHEMPPKQARQPDAAERTQLQRWVKEFLAVEAKRRAGDPGRVILRRLNNAEYTYTIRDLTGLATLEPAREFPVDGAAGEGFTNTGNALVMSPSLVTKYLDAAKQVADHAVLLPEGFRFSPGTTSRDWTEEALAKIRDFYSQFTDPKSGGEQVNLQGIVFQTNQGGRLPLERYLLATITERPALSAGSKTIEAVAAERGLSPKYLGILWRALNAAEPSLLVSGLQTRWRAAKVEDLPALLAEVTAWQKGLWKFSSVGHIGKVNGPKAWMEPVSPLVASRDVRFKIPSGETTLSLLTTDAGDGNDHDFVVWREPRLVAPGRPELPLRDVRRVNRELTSLRERLFADTAKYLSAAAEAEVEAAKGAVDIPALAARTGLDPVALRAWLDYLGVVPANTLKITGHFTHQITRGGDYDFIQGWGQNETPLLLANSSDQHVRIPGNMKPRGVAVHPSPTLRAAVGWRSPVSATVRVNATIKHAHPECGNGVTWSLELRRGSIRRRLGAGVASGNQERKAGPIDGLNLQAGDLILLSIGPRDGNHSCDLTAVDLKIVEVGGDARAWDLASDVSGDILAANPHADRLGNAGVWHFLTEPDQGGSEAGLVIPAGSVLARWQASKDADEKSRLAEETQRLLASNDITPKDGPDAALARQLRSLGGPLLGSALRTILETKPTGEITQKDDAETSWGLDPALFGRHPEGKPIESTSLFVKAPVALSLKIPPDLAEAAELVASVGLDPALGGEGRVQVDVVAGPPPSKEQGLVPSRVNVATASGMWTSNNERTSYSSPIVVNEGSVSRKRIEAALDDYRALFPAALCYSKIVPVDEVVTLTLFHREDENLARLMLDESQARQLDRLWDELHFVSRDPLTLVDVFLQLLEYASQDGDPKVFEPLRKPINDRAAEFRQTLLKAEATHLEALLDFARKAYRRSLTEAETRQLRSLYAKLRAEEIPHEEAFRLTLARVLVAPAFLYRLEKPVEGEAQGLVSNAELATRLSYFLWSSTPDSELRALADAGKLADPDVLAAQANRMLKGDKARRLATEFACQWLHIADFDQLDEKSERHFPTFLKLRSAMFEESVRFFTDLFQNDGSVLEILNADHTFLNGPLAEHYAIPLDPSVKPDEWRRVDGLKRYGRGGILGQATTLAKQSGASRTSPTLRGNWISEVLLGERLPRPPKGVPQLPDDEAATAGLTVRQLVEKHASDTKCSGCHQRIDPLGFSLEAFDAIGRKREKDLGDRPIDTRAKAMDGTEFEGLEGLSNYLLNTRRDAFVRQFCKKLLGFALGRSTELSDESLLLEMEADLKTNDYRVGVAIDRIVRSRQFREIRGRATADTD